MVVDIPVRVVLKVLLVIALFAAGVKVLLSLGPFFVSLVVAGFLAIAADPAVRWVQRRSGLGRGASVGIVMGLIILALAGAVWIFASPLIDQAASLRENSDSIANSFRDNEMFHRLDTRFHLVDKLSDEARKLPAKASHALGSTLGAILSGVASTITILFMMILMLLGGGQLVEGVVRLQPKIAERRWWSVVQGAYKAIAAYVASTILIAIIAGSVVAISLFALGLKYAAPLGLWMGLLDIIPLIGATIGAVPAVIVAFATGSVTKGVIMLIIVIVYQQLENTLLQPAIQGKIVSLSALTVFLAVLVGSQLMGILGALLAVPVAGIVKILYDQYVEGTGGHQVEMPAIAPDDAPEAPDDV
jgi:predicted PurR-regulated permease PerM